jgi:DNA-directed RNA polymerase II subunit RPB2
MFFNPFFKKKDTDSPPVMIGMLPLMLRTRYCMLHKLSDLDKAIRGECVFDQGGYFIINGSEKVIVAQERLSNNYVYVFKKKKDLKVSWMSEIRSHITHGGRPPSTMYMQMYMKGPKGTASGNQIRSSLPYIRTEIPVVVIFRALGYEADRDIIEHIVYDLDDSEMIERFRSSLEEANPVQTQTVALDYIGRRGSAINVGRNERVLYAKDLLIKEMLPHVGVDSGSEIKKAFFLGYIVHKMLMCSLGRSNEDDRDHFGKKRLDLAGPLMSSLFRTLFTKLIKEVRREVEKTLESGKPMYWKKTFESDVITRGLQYSLATGNWGDRLKSVRAGVAQVLNRLTYASSLSHLRRCNTPLAKEGKLAQPRQLHCTHWGMICPAETPEGHAVGLVKNLAMMAYISVGSPNFPIYEFLKEWSTEQLDEIQPFDIINLKINKVFLDGNWIGIHR